MKFKTWLEHAEPLSGPRDLPPIAPDCVRATNFTNPTVGPKLLAGEPFLYGRGMITSSTDAFSSNEEVWDLLTSGRVGAFDRNPFGKDVVLLDIPAREHRQHSNPSMASGKIDNSRVLGVFNRQDMSLLRNPGYNPTKPMAQLQSAPTRFRRSVDPSQPMAPMTPMPSSNIPTDSVW